MTDELSGRTLGRYQVLERLGRGGMAEVYRAYQPSLDRYVAIKVIYPHLATEAGLRERFGREARAVAALRHPNIVQVYDFDMQGDTAFMAMEFVGGPTLKAALASLVRRDKLLPLPVVGRIIGQLGEALGYAHEQQVVHRDVKPANVLLRRRDMRREAAEGAAVPPPMSDEGIDELLLGLGPASVVLTDFGVARVISDSAEQTAAGTILGSPAYMSPEQGRGERAGPTSDIYSLAVVLYELVTGRVPFDADTPFAIVVKHIQTPLPPPRMFRPDLPEPLERVLLKALAKNPADRFQDAAAFGTAVREACGATVGAPLRLVPGSRAATGPETTGGATRFIEELHATRLGTPQPAARPAGAPLPPAADTTAPPPPQRRGKGTGRRVLGCILGILVLAALVIGAFIAGGALVFKGLDEAGALVVPTQYQAEVTAAALQGTTLPFLNATSVEGVPQLTPESAEAHLARAAELAGAPDYYDEESPSRERVIAEATAALTLDPENIRALVLRGDAYSNNGQPEPAAADYSAALAIEPDNRSALVGRAGIYRYALGRPDLALADYDALIAASPDDVDARRSRLLLRGEQGQYEAAYADGDALVVLSRAEPGSYTLRGFMALALGNLEQAAADFDYALVLAGEGDLAARYGRGKVRLEQGDPASAVADLEAAAEGADELDAIWWTLYGGHRQALVDLARAYAEAGRPDEQLDALNRAVESEGDWGLPYLLRGRLRAAGGDLEGAREDLRRALELARNDGERQEVEAELRQLP